MGKFFVWGEYGYDIVDEFIFWLDEIVIDKLGKGSFWGMNIYRILFVCGIIYLVFVGVIMEYLIYFYSVVEKLLLIFVIIGVVLV